MEENTLNQYNKFVEKVRNKESNDLDAFFSTLNGGKVNMTLLLTEGLFYFPSLQNLMTL